MKKHPINKKTLQKFRESVVWQMENELYSFVAREFTYAFGKQFPNGLSKLTGSSKLVNGIPPASFHYEKIYPKVLQQKKKKKYNEHV